MTDDPGRVPAVPDLAAIRADLDNDSVNDAEALDYLRDVLDQAEGWHGAYERRCADYIALQDELIKALGEAAALRAAAPGREVEEAAVAWRLAQRGVGDVHLGAHMRLVNATDVLLAARDLPR